MKPLHVCIWAGLFATSLAQAQHSAQTRSQYELERLQDPELGRIPDHMRSRELQFAGTLPGYYPSSRQAQWGSSGWQFAGPSKIGGRTRAFAYDRSNAQRMIAGSVSGGLYLSKDGGSTWAASQGMDELRTVTCLIQDPRSEYENHWYAGTGEAYGQSASAPGAYYLGNGLLESNDGGESWSSVASTALSTGNSFNNAWQLVWNLAAAEVDGGLVLYAAIYGSIMRSADEGKTWSRVLGGTGYFTDVAIGPQGEVYASISADGAARGIHRSADGLQWEAITPSAFGLDYNRIRLEADPHCPGRLYALVNTEGWGQETANYKGDKEYNALFRYNPYGPDSARWQDLSQQLPSGDAFGRWNVQGSYDMVIEVSPVDSNFLLIGGTNLYRSQTAFGAELGFEQIGGYKKGASLPEVGVWPVHHPDQHGVAFHSSQAHRIVSYNDGGVFECMDVSAASVVWISLNNGYNSTQHYTVAIDRQTAGSDLMVCGLQDNNQQLSWGNPDEFHEVLFGDGSYCAIADSGQTFYFSKQLGKMVRATVDESGKRTSVRRIDPVGAEKYRFINPFVIDPHEGGRMYLAAGKYIWRNNDLDQVALDGSWDSISQGWGRFADTPLIANSFITALAVSEEPANRLYYGTSVKRVYRIDSADKGSPKVKDITYSPIMPSANVSCIAVNPADADELLLTYSNYGVYSVFYSPDGGTTWEKCAGNLEQNSSGSGDGPSVRWAMIQRVHNGTLYWLATSTGLYATDTLMGLNTVWVQQAKDRIGNMVCDMIVSRPEDGRVAVATHGNGIWMANVRGTEDILGNRLAPLAPTLGLKVLGNPVDREKGLKLMSEQALVSARLYNSWGEEVSNWILPSVKFSELELNCRPGVYYLEAQSVSGQKQKIALLIP
ncbi:MAG: hypothetical protein O3C22_07425 [Bacteroidetes bacterium]|nr:hypothetical protein [Bacteroidota bacterium]MDA0944014.1 hypothetical protein [Bacteroidota bacterium]MDA1112394.1 hypothetical protein [Bacteroidota bacterium]